MTTRHRRRLVHLLHHPLLACTVVWVGRRLLTGSLQDMIARLEKKPGAQPSWFFDRLGDLLRHIHNAPSVANESNTLLSAMALTVRLPPNESLALLVGRLALQHMSPVLAVRCIRNLLQMYDDSHELHRFHIRAEFRAYGLEQARSLVDDWHELRPPSVERDIMYMQMLLDLGQYDPVRMQVAVLSGTHNNLGPDAAASLANVQERLGLHLAAAEIYLNSKHDDHPAIRSGIRRARLLKRVMAEKDSSLDTFVPAMLLKNFIQTQPDKRLDNNPTIVLINAGLGPGGAEKQFVLTALQLKQHLEGWNVSVWCRPLNERPFADFRLQELAKNGVKVRDYLDTSDLPEDLAHELDERVLELLEFMPPVTRAATLPIYQALFHYQPQIAHIWQEGSIMAAGVASLLAQVPRIVLGLRSQPPPDKGRDRPEYKPFLRFLAQQSAVVLSTNSAAAVQRYAQWLKIPEADFSVVNNCVAPGENSAMVRAHDNLKTVGTIMRFDENKRPRLWIDAALEVLRTRPDTRFILVGDGPLLVAMKDKVARSGKVLHFEFPGLRQDTSSWTQQMDVFLLLSKVEGVPNAVLEAMVEGIPVIATPAGGIVDILDPQTGVLLNEPPSRVDVADAIIKLLDNPSLREYFSKVGRHKAQEDYGADQMLGSTLRLYGLSQ